MGKAKFTKYNRIHDFIVESNLPEYRFGQIVQAVFAGRIGEFSRMTTLPKPVRSDLSKAFGHRLLGIEPVASSHSAQATKVLFELAQGHRIETVRMRYRTGWESYCISTQAGCGLACRFCATGAVGLKRNLTADEITDQILYFHLCGHKIDSISFMGMGEPLANPQTFAALQILTDRELFGFSPRRITVSTVGIVPGIKELAAKFPQVNLVFSLHSPFERQRSELVPLNQQYPIAEILPLLDQHIQSTNRQVSIAYILLRDINDTLTHADGLISLLKGRGAWDYLYHVNVIQYHPAAGAPDAYAAPDEQTVGRFVRRLRSAGLNVTRRPAFGLDIDAACGQLSGRYRSKNVSMPAVSIQMPE